jgi:hypothetical protein
MNLLSASMAVHVHTSPIEPIGRVFSAGTFFALQ